MGDRPIHYEKRDDGIAIALGDEARARGWEAVLDFLGRTLN